MSEWRPIETAPKDQGILVLAGDEVVIAWWSKRGWYNPEIGGDGTYFRNPAVTHWSPIPELPPEDERSVYSLPHSRITA
jgi:hypothetical protein